MSRITKPLMAAIAVLLFAAPFSASAQSAQFWTGDGGKGKSIAILAPQATGLAANQNYIPALVQGEFVSNFSSYSAISVLDRVRLDEQYKELLSGYYSEKAKESWDLGKLSPTDYIMGGSITRTATGFAMQMIGVTPTEQARVALSGAAASNQINAQTALARGIVAQQLGNTAETMEL